jgi:FixJ family two-component response regulator
MESALSTHDHAIVTEADQPRDQDPVFADHSLVLDIRMPNMSGLELQKLCADG